MSSVTFFGLTTVWHLAVHFHVCAGSDMLAVRENLYSPELCAHMVLSSKQVMKPDITAAVPAFLGFSPALN